jgi:hypothetical protein
MASVTRHAKSRYWHACFRSRDGRQLKRSTGTEDREAALRVAVEMERAERGLPPLDTPPTVEAAAPTIAPSKERCPSGGVEKRGERGA